MTDTPTAILQARGLEVTFQVRRGLAGAKQRVRAVRGVDLDIRPGQTLAIVGESGCGKSTAARALLGLQRPTGGTVLYRGRDIHRLRRSEWTQYRTAVQVVFQDPGASLNPRKSVRRILSEVLTLHRNATRQNLPDRVSELLDSVGLAPGTFLLRRPNQLSGGQKQRVAIARALAVEPEVIIADEALSALDVSVQAQVLGLLEELQERTGVGYVFITHDLGVAEEIADDIAVMYLGQVVEYGPTDTVLSRPRHPYTRALLDSRLSADPAARMFDQPSRTLTGDLPSPSSVPDGCALHPRCPHAIDQCRTAAIISVAANTDVDPAPEGPTRHSSCLRADELDLS